MGLARLLALAAALRALAAAPAPSLGGTNPAYSAAARCCGGTTESGVFRGARSKTPRFLRSLAAATAAAACLSAAATPALASSQAAGDELEAIVEDVTLATKHRYAAKDSRGFVLDGLKVIDVGGRYVGTYHSYVRGAFRVKVATSTDLMSWTYKADLDAGASQPTIAALSDGGFLVVYEKSISPSNQLRFRHYSSLRNLLRAAHSREFTAPLRLSPTSNGTPHVYEAALAPDISNSRIHVGFHYHSDDNGDGTPDRDRQAEGVLTNFAGWEASAATGLDAKFENLTTLHQGFGAPPASHIGDRDHLLFGGYRFNLHEAQYVRDDWSSWRVFQYDHEAALLEPLEIRTHGGSRSFGNPTATRLRSPAGGTALVVTMFVFSEGAAAGEAGSLVYYRQL